MIEASADAAAATLLAGAAGFTALALSQPLSWAVPVATAALGLAFAALRRVRAVRPPFALPEWELIRLPEPIEADELLLTQVYHGDARPEPAEDELVLDDVLARLGPDSRVVRLFDPAAMPTAGQLQARIDRHLKQATPPAAPPDASQALHEALAELKRSLN